MICSFMSCKKKHNNVDLTDFTKELISMYIKDFDLENHDARNRKEEIIIISGTDSYRYYLSIFANNSKEYKFCREDFVGQTLQSGYSIRLFGDESSMFYSIDQKIKKQKRCKNKYIEYDPPVWQVCFYKDKSFCKMKTHKITIDEDISAIQSLAEKYYKVSDILINEVLDNEVYHVGEYENDPEFILGDDSLRQIISSNFKPHKKDNLGKIPIIVGIVVDKNGKATFREITKSSNDIELDSEAIRVAKLICQNYFIPASHRGEIVNAYYSILFYKEDIIP